MQGIAAEVLTEARSSGFTVRRSMTPVIRKKDGMFSVGDVVRIRLECTAQADASWVAIQDPIPCGASILGRGLGRDSRVLAAGSTGIGNRIMRNGPSPPTGRITNICPRGHGAWVHGTFEHRRSVSDSWHADRSLVRPEMFAELPASSLRWRRTECAYCGVCSPPRA